LGSFRKTEFILRPFERAALIRRAALRLQLPQRNAPNLSRNSLRELVEFEAADALEGPQRFAGVSEY
jgi:hypothetical protein